MFKKAEVAVPRSTGIKQNNGSRPARGSHVLCFATPLARERQLLYMHLASIGAQSKILRLQKYQYSIRGVEKMKAY